MYTVFVTGGIASGKSTVCRRLGALGARVIDLDALARDVLDEPLVRKSVVHRFGADVFVRPEAVPCDLAPFDEGCLDPFAGCEVDRALLAERAFASAGSTADLNAITHPRIMERLGEELCGPACCMGDAARLTVVEVPLIEACAEVSSLADEVVAVQCPLEVRRARAEGRGMSAAAFDERASRQITDEERAALAHTVLLNDGDAAALERAVDAWWQARERTGWPSRLQRPIAGAPHL